MRINRLLILAAALLLMVSCQNKAQKEQNDPEIHELLTVTAQDYTLNEEYPASIHGAQDIKIIPRVEGYLMGVYVKEGESFTARATSWDLPSRTDSPWWPTTGRCGSISR